MRLNKIIGTTTNVYNGIKEDPKALFNGFCLFVRTPLSYIRNKKNNDKNNSKVSDPMTELGEYEKSYIVVGVSTGKEIIDPEGIDYSLIQQ
ncbi:hypothetical protein GOV08_02770 [Candidatus Woesearchaeota archaeon]|nr:hypothetical protein [Candidatus Woesearchaeota archaeon]